MVFIKQGTSHNSNVLPLYTIPAGLNMPPTVAVQINQDAFTNFAGNMNLWGTLYAKQDIWNERTANFRRDISIRPTTTITQAGINIYGGETLSKYWYVGRGAHNVGPNNFVVGSNIISPIYNGLTQPHVGFQINIDRTAYFTGKAHALDGLEVRGDFNAPNNAHITTLQVNQNTCLNGGVFLNSLDIN